MKNIFIKILLIFTFILNLAFLPCSAESLGISSVTFDNSGSFMSINSPDNLDYPLEKTQIMLVEEDNEAYFEIQPARLNGTNKNYFVNTNEINEISISQEMNFIISNSEKCNDDRDGRYGSKSYIQLNKAKRAFSLSFFR